MNTDSASPHQSTHTLPTLLNHYSQPWLRVPAFPLGHKQILAPPVGAGTPDPVPVANTGSCGCSSQAVRRLITSAPTSSSLLLTITMPLHLFRHRKRSAPSQPEPGHRFVPGDPPPVLPSVPPPLPRKDTAPVAGPSTPRRSGPRYSSDAETNRQISGAFRAVGDASRGPLPGPQNEKLLTVENKAGRCPVARRVTRTES